jgi:hypothetical protein
MPIASRITGVCIPLLAKEPPPPGEANSDTCLSESMYTITADGYVLCTRVGSVGL